MTIRFVQSQLSAASSIIFIATLIGCAPVGSGNPDPARSLSSEENLTYVVPTPRASNSPNVNICQGLTSVDGIDVSPWNPNINWPQVKMGGRDFAFIKATEGDNYVSPVFRSDWAAAKNSGVLRGAYHFFRPSDDPVAQARLFLNTMGTLGADDLPVVFDWEVSDGVSASVQIQRAQIWLDIVEEATGKIPIIYTGPSFWNSLGNPPQFVRYALFIANYQVSCPWIPAPWSDWTFWQQGDNGVVSGINGNVDDDVFNGSLQELKQFARQGYL